MAKTGGKRIKTTVSLDETLWARARMRAIEERRDLQDIVADALKAYLRTPVAQKEGGR